MVLLFEYLSSFVLEADDSSSFIPPSADMCAFVVSLSFVLWSSIVFSSLGFSLTHETQHFLLDFPSSCHLHFDLLRLLRVTTDIDCLSSRSFS